MIKFIIKTMIVILAIQSAMDYLRKEEIVEGSIEINYAAIHQKIRGVVSVKKIAAGLHEFVGEKIQDRMNNDFQRTIQRHDDVAKEKRSHFVIVEHVVNRGETLDKLAQRYGVHWRVIQRVNHLSDEHKLLVGQRLRIPSPIYQLI